MHSIIAALIGIGFGIITGIAPGIHVNLVCSLLLALFPFLPFTGFNAVTFIIALAITHTFLDSIPSVFLGAPDSSSVLGVLPGHRYLLRGQGYMAVKLSTIGALGGLLLGCMTFWLFMKLTVITELIPKKVVGIVLLLVVCIMFLKDKKKLSAALIIIISATYGFIGFSYPDPLFPMLSGMFGTATMLYSLLEKSTIPKQEVLSYTTLRWRDAGQALLGGLVAGGLTAILPGVGAAHAAAIGILLAAGTGDHGYMILTGTIGTTNFFLSLAAYEAIDKARNGALLAASTISPSIGLEQSIGAAMLAGGVACIITLLLARKASSIITLIPYQKTSITVIIFVTALVVVLQGWKGLLLYSVGTCIGLLPATTKAGRAHAMSCILIPVAWRFIVG